MLDLDMNNSETITIDSLGNEGEGVARLASGQVVFVDGVLPGETCVICPENNGKRFTKGILVERLNSSDERIEPVCGNYERCGGCNLMHINYERELQYKKQKVFDCLTRIGGFDSDYINARLMDTVGSDRQANYRNHMQYTIGYKDSNGCPSIGFKASSSNDFIEIDECYIEYKIFGKIRKFLSKKFEDYPVKLWEQLILRGSERTREILVEFVNITEASHELVIRDMRAYLNEIKLGEFITNEGYTLKGIVVRISKDIATFKRRGGKRIVIEGEGFYDEILCGRKFRINAGAFFQVNVEQAEKLYTLASENLKDSKVLYDLYCGAGTIGLSMVNSTQTLIGVEISPEAVASAKVNSRLSAIDNATFICKPCEKVLFHKTDFPKPDAVIVDPPRRGMDSLFVSQLIKLQAPKISYVSCDPATMARDLKLLKNTYEIERITPVDMFTRSSHCESVCLLSKVNTRD